MSSKSWCQFARADAPELDFVISVCRNAANERAPTWRGKPLTMRWDLPAPGQVSGSDEVIRAAFTSICEQVKTAVTRFVGDTILAEENWQLANPHARDLAGASRLT